MNSDAKNHPPMWEFKHSSVFTVYRIYYLGTAVNPNIFPAVPPKISETPAKRNAIAKSGQTAKVSVEVTASPSHHAVVDVTNNGSGDELSAKARIAILQEIKVHTELLSAFEGVISGNELAERKRALYAALPVPPPAAKKVKVEHADVVAV